MEVKHEEEMFNVLRIEEDIEESPHRLRKLKNHSTKLSNMKLSKATLSLDKTLKKRDSKLILQGID
jgi:hypothetical protein